MKYMLIKTNPQGSVSTHIFDNQRELVTHLNAMLQHTTGYDIVAVVPLP